MQKRGLQEILFVIKYLRGAAASASGFVGNFTDTYTNSTRRLRTLGWNQIRGRCSLNRLTSSNM